jgi:hypothetical protein
MNDVDAVLGINANADDVAVQPVLLCWLRPHRVDFEVRRLNGSLTLRGSSLFHHALRNAERRKRANKGHAYDQILLAHSPHPLASGSP